MGGVGVRVRESEIGGFIGEGFHRWLQKAHGTEERERESIEFVAENDGFNFEGHSGRKERRDCFGFWRENVGPSFLLPLSFTIPRSIYLFLKINIIIIIIIIYKYYFIYQLFWVKTQQLTTTIWWWCTPIQLLDSLTRWVFSSGFYL